MSIVEHLFSGVGNNNSVHWNNSLECLSENMDILYQACTGHHNLSTLIDESLSINLLSSKSHMSCNLIKKIKLLPVGWLGQLLGVNEGKTWKSDSEMLTMLLCIRECLPEKNELIKLLSLVDEAWINKDGVTLLHSIVFGYHVREESVTEYKLEFPLIPFAFNRFNEKLNENYKLLLKFLMGKGYDFLKEHPYSIVGKKPLEGLSSEIHDELYPKIEDEILRKEFKTESTATRSRLRL